MSLNFPVSMISEPSGGGIPVDTIVYDINDDVLDTYTGNLPNSWHDSDSDVYRVELGSSCVTMGYSVLGYCPNLAGDLLVPAGTTLGNFFARQGADFDSIAFEEGATTVATKAFLQYTGQKEVDLVMPDSMLTLANECFNATGAKWGTLTLNEGLTTLGSEVSKFNYIGHGTTLSIPSTVTSIGSNAFQGSDFNRVECYAMSAPTIGSQAFNGMSSVSDGLFHVPVGATGYAASYDGLTTTYDLLAPPSIVSYLGKYNDNSNTNSYTFSSCGLGDAHAFREIVVVVYTRSYGAHTITGCTVGGVTATADIAQVSGGNSCNLRIFRASVPTGTTGDIVATTNFGVQNLGISVYRLEGEGIVLEDDDFTNTNAPSNATATVSVVAGGAVIAGVVQATTSDVNFVSGVTEDYASEAVGDVDRVNVCGHKSIASTDASHDVEVGFIAAHNEAFGLVSYKLT